MSDTVGCLTTVLRSGCPDSSIYGAMIVARVTESSSGNSRSR